ncbi:hypothetical protein RvY_01630 [Ramazzottius varieornatus]|uniref:Uncharacterized protein n=1 Tax=Ramazzottius varieornatus TaxID=947166 RepID=A0A1D1UN08_RAMVA|nr:hypothetical protein RvY_01630 [Ramazzottius varieornatus]
MLGCPTPEEETASRRTGKRLGWDTEEGKKEGTVGIDRGWMLAGQLAALVATAARCVFRLELGLDVGVVGRGTLVGLPLWATRKSLEELIDVLVERLCVSWITICTVRVYCVRA